MLLRCCCCCHNCYYTTIITSLRGRQSKMWKWQTHHHREMFNFLAYYAILLDLFYHPLLSTYSHYHHLKEEKNGSNPWGLRGVRPQATQLNCISHECHINSWPRSNHLAVSWLLLPRHNVPLWVSLIKLLSSFTSSFQSKSRYWYIKCQMGNSLASPDKASGFQQACRDLPFHSWHGQNVHPWVCMTGLKSSCQMHQLAWAETLMKEENCSMYSRRQTWEFHQQQPQNG